MNPTFTLQDWKDLAAIPSLPASMRLQAEGMIALIELQEYDGVIFYEA